MPPARVTGIPTIRSAAAALAALAVLVGGCQQDRVVDATEVEAVSDEGRRGEAKIVNTLCPIGKDPVHMDGHPAELTRVYQGQTIGFCCEGCVEYWDAMTPEAQAKEMAEVVAGGHAPGFRPG